MLFSIVALAQAIQEESCTKHLSYTFGFTQSASTFPCYKDVNKFSLLKCTGDKEARNQSLFSARDRRFSLEIVIQFLQLTKVLLEEPDEVNASKTEHTSHINAK